MEKSGSEMNHIVDQNTDKVSGDLNYEENEEEINNNNNELDCFITSLYLNENGDVMTTKTTTASASTDNESNDNNNNNKREDKKEEKVHLFPKCEKFYSIVTQDDVSVSIKKALHEHAMKKKNTDDEHNGDDDDEEENKGEKKAQKEGDPNIKLENKKQSKKGKNNKKTKNKKDTSPQDDKNSESASTTNTTDDVTSTPPVDSRFLEKSHLQYLTYKPALRDILERALYEIERMDTKRVMKRIEENNKDNKKGSKSDESEEKEGVEGEAIHDDADDDEVDGEGDDEDDEQQEPDDDESTTSSSHSVLDDDNKKDNSVVEGEDGDISEGDNEEMNETGSNGDSNSDNKAPTAATEAIPNHRDRVPPNKRMQITLNSFNKIYQHAYHMIYHPEKRICHTTDDRVLKKKQKQIQVFLYTHDNYFDVSSSAMFKRLDFLFSGIAGDLSHLDQALSTSTSSEPNKKASFSLDMRCLLDHPPLNSNEFLLHCTLGIFLDPKTQPDTLMIEDHISGTFSKAKDSNKPKVLFIKRGERPFKSWVENFETLEDHFSAHKNKNNNKNKQAINDIVKRPIILKESVLDKIQNAHFSHAMNTHRKNKKTHHQKNNKDGNTNSTMMTNAHESMTNQLIQKMKSMMGVSSSQHHQQQQQQRLYNGYEHHSNSRKKDNFTSADISIYGSCSTNLYLNDNDNSDVDISLSLPPLDSLQQELHSAILQSRKQQQQQQQGSSNLNKKNKKSKDELIQKEQITEIHEQYQRLLKRYMFSLKHKLERNICFNIQQCLHWARVPVMKGTYSTGKYVSDGVMKEEFINFDICFQNRIAVLNSNLILEYANINERVRKLMLLIKTFAKLHGIASSPDGTLSSYSWNVLVIFYLQCLDFIPNLQCREMMKKYKARNNHKRQPEHQQQNFIGLDTSFLTFSQIETNKLWKRDKIWHNITTPMLLYGFFRFYAYIFPQSIYAVSIRLGKCCLLKSAFPKSKFWRMCIEDPFEAHYCHQSHDLGSHLCETGQAMISQKMRFAADTMQKIIIGNCFNNRGGEKKWTMDDHSMSAIFSWDTRKNKSTGFNVNNNNNGFKGRQHNKGQKRNNSRNQERKPKNHKNLGRRNQDIRSNKDGSTNNNSNNKNNVRDTENKTNPTGKKKDTTTKVATRDQQKANTERNQTNNTKAKKK